MYLHVYTLWRVYVCVQHAPHFKRASHKRIQRASNLRQFGPSPRHPAANLLESATSLLDGNLCRQCAPHPRGHLLLLLRRVSLLGGARCLLAWLTGWLAAPVNSGDRSAAWRVVCSQVEPRLPSASCIARQCARSKNRKVQAASRNSAPQRVLAGKGRGAVGRRSMLAAKQGPKECWLGVYRTIIATGQQHCV